MRASQFPSTQHDRGLTKGESRAVEYEITSLIDSFQAAFSKVVEVSFQIGIHGANARLAYARRQSAAIVVCKFILQAQGRQGEAVPGDPRIALDPLNDVLARAPNANRNIEDAAGRKISGISRPRDREGLRGHGEAWDDWATSHVSRWPAYCSSISPTSLIPLKNGSRSLFNCELGQKEGFYTVRIEEKIDGEQEFINRIIGNQP